MTAQESRTAEESDMAQGFCLTGKSDTVQESRAEEKSGRAEEFRKPGLEPREAAARLKPAAETLADWYQENARALPWRTNPTPYRVWISEIMLQQTRIEAVIPYYQRFLAEIPDVRALAEIPEERLLKLWEGLGYYSRARNLQKAARICQEQYGGKLPGSFPELIKLPGIGPYTAGAIASIAFGEKCPSADGNVVRVLSRLLAAYPDNLPDKPAAQKAFGAVVREIMEKTSLYPGTVNESLMELGETVCLPNGKPLCGACPVSALCLSCRNGTQELFPPEIPKKKRRVEERTVFLLTDGEKLCLHKRPPQGLLASLWELPACDGYLTQQEAEAYIGKILGAPVRAVPAGTGKHIFTHLEWHMTGYRVECPGSLENYGEALSAAGFCAVDRQEIGQDYAIPSAFSRWSEFWASEPSAESAKKIP